MAKLCATTVAEVLKQVSLEGNKMEHSNTNDSVPILKKDDLNEYMAWSDSIHGLILATEWSMVIDEKKMHYMLGVMKKQDDLLNMDPSNANEANSECND